MRTATLTLLVVAAAESVWAGAQLTSYTASFETVDSNGNPTSVAPIPGPYAALNWPNWYLHGLMGCNKQDCGVPPNSFPANAKYELASSNPAYGVNTTKTSNTFGAAYAGSRVKDFTLDSLWVGCSSVLALASTGQRYSVGGANCSLTFTGYADDAGLNVVATKQINFVQPIVYAYPSNYPNEYPLQVSFTQFTGLRLVKIEATIIPPPPGAPFYTTTAPAILLDDVQYRVANVSASRIKR